jgi:hypothetical protein
MWYAALGGNRGFFAKTSAPAGFAAAVANASKEREAEKRRGEK